MITEHDLREAIAECQGVRDPTANTCIKLAAYYTLLDHMTEAPVIMPSYSYAEPPEQTISFDSGTEFGEIINGMDTDKVLRVLDEMMSLVQATQPRLYAAVIRKLREE